MMIDYMGLLPRPFVVKVSYPGPDFAAGYDVHHPDYAGVLQEAGSSSDGSVVNFSHGNSRASQMVMSMARRGMTIGEDEVATTPEAPTPSSHMAMGPPCPWIWTSSHLSA